MLVKGKVSVWLMTIAGVIMVVSGPAWSDPVKGTDMVRVLYDVGPRLGLTEGVIDGLLEKDYSPYDILTMGKVARGFDLELSTVIKLKESKKTWKELIDSIFLFKKPKKAAGTCGPSKDSCVDMDKNMDILAEKLGVARQSLDTFLSIGYVLKDIEMGSILSKVYSLDIGEVLRMKTDLGTWDSVIQALNSRGGGNR